MSTEKLSVPQEAPKENFSRGLYRVEIPELGKPIEGKVRDSWVLGQSVPRFRVLVTTDRQSSFDKIVCTTPRKGKVLNLLSAYWFKHTEDIIPNHMIDVPHPNVLVAREAAETLPVEVIVRGYMAKSSSKTSVYRKYENGRRNIYGIKFKDGLKANQRFEEPIVTPTTKAGKGKHDEELTDEETKKLVDQQLGEGLWDQAKLAALSLFQRGQELSLEKGLILVDTKYEFGVDDDGQLMAIDEMHTPDSSRFWLAETYQEKFEKGENPENYDKEILRRFLAENGFTGGDGQPIPTIDPEIIDQLSGAYEALYKKITGQDLPTQDKNVARQARRATLDYINATFFK